MKGRKKKKRRKNRSKRKPNFSNVEILNLAVNYNILAVNGERVEFTDQFRDAVGNAFHGQNIDFSNPAELARGIRIASVFAIIYCAKDISYEEIHAMLQVVEAMTNLNEMIGPLSTLFSKSGRVEEVKKSG